MSFNALCGVQTNDFLTSTQMVAVGGTLVLLSANGATLGSPLAALAMDLFGLQAFFGSLGVTFVTVALFGLVVFSLRGDARSTERGSFMVMASTMLTAALNLHVELEEIEAAGTDHGRNDHHGERHHGGLVDTITQRIEETSPVGDNPIHQLTYPSCQRYVNSLGKLARHLPSPYPGSSCRGWCGCE